MSKDFSCRFCLLAKELIISFDRKVLPWKQVFWRDRPEKQSFLSGEFYSLQFSSVAQSFLTLCDLMDCSMPGLPVHHQLLEFTQTHVY